MRWFDRDGRPNRELLAALAAVREVLTSGGRTVAQGSIGWIWARSDRTVPIPGFRTVAQVEENAGALRFGPLEPGQVREIEALLGRGAGRREGGLGLRYHRVRGPSGIGD
jgi:aryl-alcohol dehydrogenase-like predicted oxidoreductase